MPKLFKQSHIYFKQICTCILRHQGANDITDKCVLLYQKDNKNYATCSFFDLYLRLVCQFWCDLIGKANKQETLGL